MGQTDRRRRARNAGAFIGPSIMVAVPMRTLSDDYDDRPVEPDDDRVPEPERRGILRRALEHLIHPPRR